MIIRIFRIEIDPSKREAFEQGFYSLSVDTLKSARGYISHEIGKPTRWAPDTYIMISRWENEEALIAFAGRTWNMPVIPPGMEGFAFRCSVEHYIAVE